jgi:hypothetical protein
MGDESLFLLQLVEDGYRMLYSPAPVVGHRIHAGMITVEGIRQRAAALGRGSVHIGGLCRRGLLDKHPALWRVLRWGVLNWSRVRYLRARMSLSATQRVVRSLEPITDIAYNLESLRLATETTNGK